jgi:hypothetical protein
MSWNAMLTALAVVSSDPRLGKDGSFVEITEGDAAQIRAMIRAQLAAFRTGNAEQAFALSSPDIRATFEQPQKLLAVVHANYAPLADPHQVFFGELVITPDGLGQVLELVDGSGCSHHALYLVDRDARGCWLAHGCMITAAPELRDGA